MKIVSTSYVNTASFNDPVLWLERINFYTGILEQLATRNEVESIEQINYSGELKKNNVTYHFLNFKKPVLYFPGQLHAHIQKLQPGVVLVNGFIFPLQIIQLRIKLGSGVKIIVINQAERPFHGIKKYLQQLAGKYIDAFLFSAGELGKEWIENGNIKNSRKIYEVMHGSSFFCASNKGNARTTLSITGSTIFLWVGRLNDNKDPLTVVKAFLQFSTFNPGAKLYMIFKSAASLPGS